MRQFLSRNMIRAIAAALLLLALPSMSEAAGESLGIASVPNLRDVGGHAAAEGSTVRLQLLYRSNQLSGISAEDMEKIAGLGLKRAYDLRTEEERRKRPDELPPGVESDWLNVLADEDQAGPAELGKLLRDPKQANAALGGGRVEAMFAKSYRDFVTLPSARREYRKLFLGLADRSRLPAVFHCTTGKDRTGWAAAALLSLFGVAREEVYADFLRSNDYILPLYSKPIDRFLAAGGDPSIPPAVLGVKREYLEAAFDEMETRYGTIENYFAEGLGIDDAQQQALRDVYLARP